MVAATTPSFANLCKVLVGAFLFFPSCSASAPETNRSAARAAPRKTIGALIIKANPLSVSNHSKRKRKVLPGSVARRFAQEDCTTADVRLAPDVAR
jgi:hypothetical protein